MSIKRYEFVPIYRHKFVPIYRQRTNKERNTQSYQISIQQYKKMSIKRYKFVPIYRHKFVPIYRQTTNKERNTQSYSILSNFDTTVQKDVYKTVQIRTDIST